MHRKKIEDIAREIRKCIIKMHQRGPNLGSALSIADILAVLYFDIMRIKSPGDPDRDRFILSKGHAVSGLYAALALKGFFRKGSLDSYLRDGSVLCGHPARGCVPGIEASTGSLGHGLPIGAGMALAAKHDKKRFRIYVLMGDGECQEGTVWEAAMLASRLKLDNLVGIIDANNLQGYDRVSSIQPVETFKAKWKAFGWGVCEVNGHNVSDLRSALKRAPFIRKRPSMIIARTVKGKGIKEAEDKLGWHYFSIPKDKVQSFIDRLED